mmetsp:Transcript_96338/g.241535  ORF Transcript_96338/g.241535 Transcript_96338/m.241535 type:complete len:202 (+) Transcript_96338:4785-5390(+)
MRAPVLDSKMVWFPLARPTESLVLKANCQPSVQILVGPCDNSGSISSDTCASGSRLVGGPNRTFFRAFHIPLPPSFFSPDELDDTLSSSTNASRMWSCEAASSLLLLEPLANNTATPMRAATAQTTESCRTPKPLPWGWWSTPSSSSDEPSLTNGMLCSAPVGPASGGPFTSRSCGALCSIGMAPPDEVWGQNQWHLRASE